MTRSPVRALGIAARLLFLLAVGFAAIGACAAPRFVIDAAVGSTASPTFHLPAHERLVALTIDDGPAAAETAKLLEVLERHDAQATLFVIGDQVAGREALLREAVSAGHELANHGWTAQPAIALSPTTLRQDLLRTAETLRPYGPVNWFRPGGGAYDASMLSMARELGYRVALGDVFPYDAMIPSSAFHAWYILEHVAPGSIIVLHDDLGRGLRTAQTLDAVLPKLRARGYRVVTLSELARRAVIAP